MKVFVVNAYSERADKYKSDSRYTLFPAVWWENVTDEEVEKHHFRHNAKLNYRKKVVACSKSHKNLLLKIIQEDLKNTIIIEDDCLFDFDRIDELNNLSEFTYLGGDVTSPFMKDMKDFHNNDKQELIKSFCYGINTIDPKIFKIGQASGYFIPDAQTASHILANIPHGKIERAIDTEFISQQKKGIINYFIYPPLVKMYLPDAKNGFTASRNKLYGDYSNY
jgi:GR25 family glycosyltransferase involved in LPS biosynthesis